MMDITHAKNCQKTPKKRHIQPPYSLFYLRKCLTNSGRYILYQSTKENSNAICSLVKTLLTIKYTTHWIMLQS